MCHQRFYLLWKKLLRSLSHSWGCTIGPGLLNRVAPRLEVAPLPAQPTRLKPQNVKMSPRKGVQALIPFCDAKRRALWNQRKQNFDWPRWTCQFGWFCVESRTIGHLSPDGTTLREPSTERSQSPLRATVLACLRAICFHLVWKSSKLWHVSFNLMSNVAVEHEGFERYTSYPSNLLFTVGDILRFRA